MASNITVALAIVKTYLISKFVEGAPVTVF